MTADPKTSTASSRRIQELDVFRGVAALLVVLAHYLNMSNTVYGEPLVPADPGWWGKVFDGGMAVNFFFMISGFVIFMTIRKVKTVGEFAALRVARLYPAYIAAVTLTCLFMNLFPVPPTGPFPRGDTQITPLAYAANLTMFQSWFGITSVDGVYWSLVAEISFYVIMAILFRAGLLGRIELIAVIWAAVCVAARVAEIALDFQIPEIVRLTFLLRFGPLFMAGILFYRIWSGEGTRRTWALVLLMLAALSFVEYGGKLSQLKYIAAFAIFALFATGRLTWIVFRPLVFLGTISYSLYLTHFTAGLMMIKELRTHEGLTPWPAVLATIALFIAISTVITYGVERPGGRFLRKLFARRPRPASVPVPVTAPEGTAA